MPYYAVNHITPLSSTQQDALVERITFLHSRKYHTPSLFVNVVFEDVGRLEGKGRVSYVGGRKRPTNHIIAHHRPSSQRTRSSLESLCKDIIAAWNEIVVNPSQNTNTATDLILTPPSTPHPDLELRMVVIMADISAGIEAGFGVPEAGGEVEWLRENMGAFRELADAGDEDLKGLVREVEGREDLRGKLEG